MEGFFDFAARKMPFASVNRLVYFAPVRPDGDGSSGTLHAAVDCHLNLTHCGDTKSSMRRDVSDPRTSI
jgi:hypothetical protein